MTEPWSEASASTGELRARQPKAVHSALVVLEEVARAGPGVTAREVSVALGMPRATAYRLLNLLVQDEYLVRMPDLSGFTLGRKVAELAGLVGVVTATRPPRAARDHLRAVREGVRGGVHLIRYESMRLVPVDVDPDFPLGDEAAMQRWFDASAAGLLFLASRQDSEVSGASVRGSAEELGSRLDGVRRCDYALRIDSARACLAVPIRGADGDLVAALCLSGTSDRDSALLERLGALRESAGHLAPLLE